jgi:DNA-binding Lrp family transcriptional regulator
VDALDRSILAALRVDGRATNAAIGAQIGLTESAVRRRVDRLRADGTIQRFTVDTVPLGAEGLVLVRCRPGATPRIARSLRDLARAIFEASGEYDLGAFVERGSAAELNDAIDRIRALPGVLSTTTLIPLVRDPTENARRPRRRGRPRTASRGVRALRAPGRSGR